MNRLFSKSDILLPAPGTDLSRWSVIACDQHTSEPEYWQALEEYVGTAPSTLRMMLPEAYLDRNVPDETEKINRTMRAYLEDGVLKTLPDSYIYLERSLPGGVLRKGIVGVIDLDAYDYASGSRSPVRATEGTVEERLPPRVRIRKEAPLEMPHVMVFANDPSDTVFSTCSSLVHRPQSPKSGKVYDFDLNANGGHIAGWRLTGSDADIVDAVFDRLFADASEDVLLAIGDGNHSLAAAKKCGDRYALVEIVNIHDPAIVFEPIHRVVFGTDTTAFEAMRGTKLSGCSENTFSCACECGFSCDSPTHILKLSQNSMSYGDLVRSAEKFCQDYVAAHGGKIDYIHNDETAITMGAQPGCFAVLLPALDKTELFACVAENGPYPKKSFSIGHADEKRFYLECRKR